MRKSAAVTLLAVALLLVAAAPSYAWQHGVRTRVFVGVGVGPAFWWGPPYPYWGYYPPVYYYPPPPVVVQAPPVYIQQPPPPPPQSYWYYCPSANAYYPNVQSCPEPWLKVAPRPE